METNRDDSVSPIIGEGIKTEWGLTKREHFAAMALQGLLSNPYYVKETYIDLVEGAVRRADALIEALNKSK